MELKKCKCNFNPPHPLRQDNISGVWLNDEYYPEEYFCSFCKGLIVNDMEYIAEVVRYYAQQRWSSISWDVHKDRMKEIEWGQGHFLKMWKKLLTLSK